MKQKSNIPTALEKAALRADDRVAHAFDYYKEAGFFSPNRSLLSIGSGLGEVELMAGKELGMTISLVEPADSYRSDFEKKIVSQGLQSQLIGYHQGRYETFSTDRNLIEFFPLILGEISDIRKVN